MSTCLSVVQSYADFLSNNPGTKAQMPHPLIFSETSCSGVMWPPFNEDPPLSIFFDNPLPTGRFGSIYIPAFWQVRVSNSSSQNPRSRLVCASETPFMETDASGMFFDSLDAPPACFGQGDTVLDRTQPGLLNNVRQLRFDRVRPNTGSVEQGGQVYPERCWLLDRCRNGVSNRLGARNLRSFTPGSEECDDLMLDHCSGRDGGPCDDYVGPNIDLPECSCLREEGDLVCQGPGCEKEAVLPVTCFGGSCNAQGYRFGRMVNQKCSVTMCQQVVDLVGDSIAVNSEMTMHCGEPVNTVLSSTPVLPVNKVEQQRVNDRGQTSGLPSMYIVACLVLVLVFVVIPMSFLLLGKRVRSEASN